jgi:hypothetical protein
MKRSFEVMLSVIIAKREAKRRESQFWLTRRCDQSARDVP